MPPSRCTYRVASARSELHAGSLLGVRRLRGFGLFVLMALAQMMGDVKPPEATLDRERSMASTRRPEIEEVEEEEPPPPEEEEPPPELEAEPPQLSLDQLDIALNPGTGGSLAGDFAMPTIGSSSASALGTEDFVDFSNLDQMPRPIGVSGFNFPRRLLKQEGEREGRPAHQARREGRVIEVEVDSSTCPNFDELRASTVEEWKLHAAHAAGPPRQGEGAPAHPDQHQAEASH